MNDLYNYTLIPLIDYLLLPLYLAIFYKIAYSFRNKHYKKNHPWRPYFIPLLSLKIIGALFISFIYTYYYDGGDTINIYHNSRYINEIFSLSPRTWLELITRTINPNDPVFYNYADGIYFYRDKATFTVCIISSFINFFTFNSFILTAVSFAFLSFWGVWAMFRAFATLYPNLTKPLAYAALYIPSTIVWGSGIFKDTVCLFALGWLFNSTVQLVVKRNFSPKVIIIAILSFMLLVQIKLYIAMSFLPALLLWIFFYYTRSIRNSYARNLAKFIMIAIITGVTLVGLSSFSAQLGQYSLDKLAKTSEVTRDYIKWVSGDEGSAYSLGNVGSGIGGMLAKFPAAVNVTLFRPYPWEARKPIVALTALEALLFLFVTLKLLFEVGIKKIWSDISSDPTIQFSLVFTLIFAFA
ncbi:MAG TPA: hypothetical protein VFV31_07650, partial [Chitinophagaceae bacterium]|nr:hypothetical protein [Chitinophagaceae bacterium]